jgi:hypothetical protein
MVLLLAQGKKKTPPSHEEGQFVIEAAEARAKSRITAKPSLPQPH